MRTRFKLLRAKLLATAVVLLAAAVYCIAGLLGVSLPWIKLCWVWLSERLRPEHYDRIRVNAKCPACGHRNGSIRVVIRQAKAGAPEKKVIEHTCLVCDATFAEEPLRKADEW